MRSEVDFATLAREIVAGAPDLVVYEGLNPQGALIVRALREGLYTGAFMGPDALLSRRDFLEAGGPTTEGAILTGGHAPDELFAVRFEGRFGRRPSTPFVLQSHDAVTILLQAIDKIAVEDGDRLIIDRTELLGAIRGTEFIGLTGTITFDEHGDRLGETPSELGLRIYRVREGMFEPID
jgi:branched-chain amino acid transport system substrate-binding protein